MKMIPIAQLRAHADGNLWHLAWNVGLSKNGVSIEVPDDFPLDAQVTSSARATAFSVSAELVEERASTCAKCEWNFNWICQHIGCLPCKQKSEGGLKAIIATSAFKCPINRVR